MEKLTGLQRMAAQAFEHSFWSRAWTFTAGLKEGLQGLQGL